MQRELRDVLQVHILSLVKVLPKGENWRTHNSGRLSGLDRIHLNGAKPSHRRPYFPLLYIRACEPSPTSLRQNFSDQQINTSLP